MRTLRKAQEFRTYLAIRLAVLCALLIWLTSSVVCVTAELPNSAFLSSALFSMLFFGFVSYYWSMAYVVDEYGVTYRGARDFEHFDWDEIVHLSASELPLGGYYVSTRSGQGFVLSRFVRGHRELAEVIAARAGLMPIRS